MNPSIRSEVTCPRRANAAADTRWPRKTRELINAHVDSTIWNAFRFRDGDIVIASWGKSGCTWLQQIVSQLLFVGRGSVAVAEVSPWVEFALFPPDWLHGRLETQSHRRFVKTHLPVDALVYSPRAKYLYIARDGRDVVWSLYNHFRRLNAEWYSMMRRKRGRFGRLPEHPPESFRRFFRQWLDEDGFPFWPYWPHVQSWWNIRTLPNLMLLHFTELRHDLPATARRISAFLEIDVSEDDWPVVLEHCSLGHMRRNAHQIVMGAGLAFEGGAQSFFAGGGQSRWEKELSQADVACYEQAVTTHLSTDCAAWLHGRCRAP